MLFRNLIWLLGFKSWEYKLPTWINFYSQKRKITLTNMIIRQNQKNSYSPSPINNIYIERVDDYPIPTYKQYFLIFLYNIWSILLLLVQCIQPAYLIYKCIHTKDNLQELINIFLLYILIPLHYLWAKLYFSTNHFDTFFLKTHWECNNYCNKLCIVSILVSFLSVVPHVFYNEQLSHYWSYNSDWFLITFLPLEIIGRNIVIINSGLFILVFYNHLRKIYKFTMNIDTGKSTLQFDNLTVLSDFVIELVKIKSELKCSIERFEYLVSITTGIGGSALILFVQHKFTVNNFKLSSIEIYTVVALFYYLISQLIFFYILYKYSNVRENIHKYINSINFMNKYVKRSDVKKINSDKLIVIEEETATTLDWIILDRLTKENWIDFTILGVSTRDGSLLKKVLTFSTIFYALLKFF